MNVLVLGSGAREHALSWAISRSPSVRNVFVAPGNPGTAEIAENLAVNIDDIPVLIRTMKKREVGLLVVGPENPLAKGVADAVREANISVFGPGVRGAILEASKSYAKRFMKKHGIPHPGFWTYDTLEEALAHIDSHQGPYVIKADGLALGKGVFIVEGVAEAKAVVRDIMERSVLGEAGRRVVFEEFLTGREMTAMILTDGQSHYTLPFSADHKRALEGDEGPMTGGMGAYSPVPWLDEATIRAIEEDVILRTLNGLRDEGIDYRGCIYAGLMITGDGPKVLEYNVRLGDPETQCVLPRLDADFGHLFSACAEGHLAKFLKDRELRERDEACATVVLASQGYPGAYSKGIPIYGLDEARSLPGTVVFHAGTRVDEGVIKTAGGRVLSVTALGENLNEALESAYRGVSKIRFDGMTYRRDIGRVGM